MREVRKRFTARKTLAWSLFLLLLFPLGFSNPSAVWSAEGYPNKPINMVVPYGPASAIDMGSKILADRMAEFLGQPLVSVYKPGGGGSLGAAFVAQSKPDGYTVLVGGSSALALSPIVKKLDYKMEDFIIMGTYAKTPLWLAVKADAPWKTLKEFVEEARKNPGKFLVGTYGKLTAVDFILELLNKHAGIKLINVPYKSSGEALTAVLGGHAHGAMVSSASGHLEAGTIRILAAAEEKRLDGLSDVPIFKDFGYPIVLDSLHSFCLPQKTPKNIVNRFFDAQKKAFEKYPKEIRASLRKVELWDDFRGMEEGQKNYKDAQETLRKIARELNVVAK